MIQTTKLPEKILAVAGENTHGLIKPQVEKRSIEDIEVQYLDVAPWSCIKMHGHENPKKWEVWIHLAEKTAYVCLKDEQHELVNNSGTDMILMAMKGQSDCSYDELKELFCGWGFKVKHGSLVFNG